METLARKRDISYKHDWTEDGLACLQLLDCTKQEQKSGKQKFCELLRLSLLSNCVLRKKHWIQKQMKKKTDLDSTAVLVLVSSAAKWGFLFLHKDFERIIMHDIYKIFATDKALNILAIVQYYY